MKRFTVIVECPKTHKYELVSTSSEAWDTVVPRAQLTVAEGQYEAGVRKPHVRTTEKLCRVCRKQKK